MMDFEKKFEFLPLMEFSQNANSVVKCFSFSIPFLFFNAANESLFIKKHGESKLIIFQLSGFCFWLNQNGSTCDFCSSNVVARVAVEMIEYQACLGYDHMLIFYAALEAFGFMALIMHVFWFQNSTSSSLLLFFET